MKILEDHPRDLVLTLRKSVKNARLVYDSLIWNRWTDGSLTCLLNKRPKGHEISIISGSAEQLIEFFNTREIMCGIQ